jgi:hypothetical protein
MFSQMRPSGREYGLFPPQPATLNSLLLASLRSAFLMQRLLQSYCKCPVHPALRIKVGFHNETCPRTPQCSPTRTKSVLLAHISQRNTALDLDMLDEMGCSMEGLCASMFLTIFQGNLVSTKWRSRLTIRHELCGSQYGAASSEM